MSDMDEFGRTASGWAAGMTWSQMFGRFPASSRCAIWRRMIPWLRTTFRRQLSSRTAMYKGPSGARKRCWRLSLASARSSASSGSVTRPNSAAAYSSVCSNPGMVCVWYSRARLDRERAAARATFDWSAQTDANVLLRRHQNADHAA